jgi:hypothetical protein
MKNYKILNLDFMGISLLIGSLFTICYYLIQHFLITKNVYFNSFGEQLTLTQIEDIFNIQSKYEFLSYLLLFFIGLLKYIAISLILYIAFIISDLKVSYYSLIKVVAICEIIFLLPLILKLIWFLNKDSNFTVEDVQFFMPLSLLNIFDYTTLNKILIYPFQLLNVFEIIYWIALAYGISKLINNNFDKAFKIVLSSYIPALIVWVVFVMFLTITLNPA